MSESKKSAEQIEQERLTRRQALRKLGFGAGLSAIMLLGADDLARMVGRRLQQMEGDNKVAEQIAKEFRSAGVAFASGPSGTPCPPLFCDCIATCTGVDGRSVTDCANHCEAVNNYPPSGCTCP